MPPLRPYQVFFDGALVADAVFQFEEAAIGHARDNVDGGYVSHALVLKSVLPGVQHDVVLEYPLPLAELEAMLATPAAEPGPRGRLSDLAEPQR